MTWNTPLARVTLLLALGLTVLLVGLKLRSTDEGLVEPGDVQPPGRWHLQSSRLATDLTDEETARVLSLPYVSGSSKAPILDGVLRHDPERSMVGINLYVSGHGPEALLIDMQGGLLHRWRLPFEAAFPDRKPNEETAFYRRAFVYPNGDLLALIQTGGILKLDRDSNLLWASAMPCYNHLTVDSEGRILTIAKRARDAPELRPEESILEDSIVVLNPEGELVQSVSLLRCFADSSLADVIHPLPKSADIFHTNTILPIPTETADTAGLFRAGWWMISMREIDTVAVVDPLAERVEAAWRGPWRAQHQPVPLPNGKVLLFDNGNFQDGSRILEFDPQDGQPTWQFPVEGQERIYSQQAGSCQRLANGNTLITESENGRAIEITPDGRVVWEFVSPHRAGERRELIATLFEVIRFSIEDLPFAHGYQAE